MARDLVSLSSFFVLVMPSTFRAIGLNIRSSLPFRCDFSDRNPFVRCLASFLHVVETRGHVCGLQGRIYSLRRLVIRLWGLWNEPCLL